MYPVPASSLLLLLVLVLLLVLLLVLVPLLPHTNNKEQQMLTRRFFLLQASVQRDAGKVNTPRRLYLVGDVAVVTFATLGIEKIFPFFAQEVEQITIATVFRDHQDWTWKE